MTANNTTQSEYFACGIYRRSHRSLETDILHKMQNQRLHNQTEAFNLCKLRIYLVIQSFTLIFITLLNAIYSNITHFNLQPKLASTLDLSNTLTLAQISCDISLPISNCKRIMVTNISPSESKQARAFFFRPYRKKNTHKSKTKATSKHYLLLSTPPVRELGSVMCLYAWSKRKVIEVDLLNQAEFIRYVDQIEKKIAPPFKDVYVSSVRGSRY
uniref:Uncharacterized protein n=1 Tax=Glossina pallidipes TaxID=7398 RepID=A0A1A9ZNT4_GLOPL